MFFLDIGRDYVRSNLARSDRAELGVINRLFKDMAEEALKDVEAFNVTMDDLILEKSAEMRYQGQYHVLEVKLPEHEITEEDLRELETRFHALHEELFTFSLPWVPMELISLRLTAKITSHKLPMKTMPLESADASKALSRLKDCHFDNQCSSTPVYDGLKLKAGNIIRGNALVQEPTATTVIPANNTLRVDAFGNYIITPTE